MYHDGQTKINVSVRDVLLLLTLTFTTLWAVFVYTRDWRTRRRRLVQLAACLPGPPTLPLVGNALRFACKPDHLLDRIVEVIAPYEDVSPMRVWMGPALYVVITAPRDIEVVLNSAQASYKGMIYKFLMPFIGDGLISGSGKSWKSHRKLVSRTLKNRTLRGYVEIFEKRSRILMEKMRPRANGKIFDILDLYEACTTDIVCETVMGYSEMNAQENLDHEFVEHTREMYKIIYDRMLKIWLYPDPVFKLTRNHKRQVQAQNAIRGFTKMCIAAKRKERAALKSDSENAGDSILERILEINDETRELSDAELRDEIYTVYIASQDTVTLTSSFCTLMLGMHQDIQAKAREEVQSVLTPDEPITTETLSRLRYVEMVVKETLRLFPIAPFLVRRLENELELDTCTLPQGCQVLIACFMTQRSTKYWDEPLRFMPDRFSPEETAKRHPYSYTPFSGGPMNCIGQNFAMMSLKVIVADLLRTYKIGTNVRMEDIKLRADISIRSINGYHVSLEPL